PVSGLPHHLRHRRLPRRELRQVRRQARQRVVQLAALKRITVTTDTAASRPALTIAVDAACFPRRVFATLLAIEAALLLLDVAIAWLRIVDVQSVRNLFSLARESCLGNWFSSTQTLFVGLVVWLIARAARDRPGWTARGWTAVACFFVYMAVDDGAAIHERVGSAARYFIGSLPIVRRYPSYMWQVA